MKKKLTLEEIENELAVKNALGKIGQAFYNFNQGYRHGTNGGSLRDISNTGTISNNGNWQQEQTLNQLSNEIEQLKQEISNMENNQQNTSITNENKNIKKNNKMGKNIVKLNESQLRQIVTESVKQILSESEEDEGAFDWLRYGAKKAGQKAQSAVQGAKDAIQRGADNFKQGVQNARNYSQAKDSQRAANKNAGKVDKYIQTLNDMYNSGLFNGISYGRRAMSEIQDLIKTLNQVSGGYRGNASAWNNDAQGAFNE